MVYNAVPTITTGDVATASWANTYIKNNFAEGVPDIFTTDGDMAVATGANAAERVSVMSASNFLKHEVGGLEIDISNVATGGVLAGASSGVWGINTTGTTALIEAGTDSTARLWTAAQIKEGIDEHGGGLLTTVVNESRAAAAASGDVSYTGAGFRPTAIIVLAENSTSDDAFSIGLGDDAAGEKLIVARTLAATPVMSTETRIVQIESAGTGFQLAVLTSLDADGCTFTWTKESSGRTVSFVIMYLR